MTIKNRDLVALTEKSTEKINGWIAQASAKKEGVKITRKAFVNWLIERESADLSKADLTALAERFYDEAALLRRRLKALRKNTVPAEISDKISES